MGCTPSKTTAQDNVCKDLDTCSTFVSSLKMSSTGDKPSLREHVGKTETQTAFLNVPRNDFHKGGITHLPSIDVQSSWKRNQSCSKESISDNDTSDAEESAIY